MCGGGPGLTLLAAEGAGVKGVFKVSAWWESRLSPEPPYNLRQGLPEGFQADKMLENHTTSKESKAQPGPA